MERYETISKLANGSSGVVYLAKDKQANGALVAIKVYQQAHIMPQVLKSAIREATLLRQCNGHPHIVQLHLAFRSERGRVYLVEEYVPRSLESLLRKQGGLPWDMVWDLTYQLLVAIKFMHKKKVIHRDLKPGNLMLTDDGALKVIDFGLARQDRPADGRLTPYVLTRWYRAPEVLVGAAYGHEVDIWAAGCIAAELATGQPLFPGTSHMDQLQLLLHCFGELPARLMDACSDLFIGDILVLPDPDQCEGLASRLHGMPPDFVKVIQECLQLDPLLRPTAEELLWMPCFSAVGLAKSRERDAGAESPERRSTATSEDHSSEITKIQPEQLELEGGEPHIFVGSGSGHRTASTAGISAFSDHHHQQPPHAALHVSAFAAEALTAADRMGSLCEELAFQPAGADGPTTPRAKDGVVGPTWRPNGAAGVARLASATPQLKSVLNHRKTFFPPTSLNTQAPYELTAAHSYDRSKTSGTGSELTVAHSDRSADAASMSRLRKLVELESRLFGMSPQPPGENPPQRLSPTAASSGKKADTPEAPRYTRRSVDLPSSNVTPERTKKVPSRSPSFIVAKELMSDGSSNSPSSARRSNMQSAAPAGSPRGNRFGWAESKLGAKNVPVPNLNRASVERETDRSSPIGSPPARGSLSGGSTPASAPAAGGNAKRGGAAASVAATAGAAASAPFSRVSTDPPTLLQSLHSRSLSSALQAEGPKPNLPPEGPTSVQPPGSLPAASSDEVRFITAADGCGPLAMKANEDMQALRLPCRPMPTMRVTNQGVDLHSPDRFNKDKAVSFGAALAAASGALLSDQDLPGSKESVDTREQEEGVQDGRQEDVGQVLAWRGRSVQRRLLSAFVAAEPVAASPPRKPSLMSPGSWRRGQAAQKEPLKGPSLEMTVS